MNLQDLQQSWGTLEVQNNLVTKLFKESRQSKVAYNLKKNTLYSVLFMLFNLAVIIYTWFTLVENFPRLTLVVQSLLLLILSKIIFYKNVWQLDMIAKINYTEPIIKTQKTIEQLKIQRIKHNRFIFTFCILYFWLMVSLLFRWDITLLIPSIWANAPIVVVIHLGMLILWFPIAFWILKKYDSTKIVSKFWNKMRNESFLTNQSVNSSLNNALSYLQEIKSFEKDETSN